MTDTPAALDGAGRELEAAVNATMDVDGEEETVTVHKQPTGTAGEVTSSLILGATENSITTNIFVLFPSQPCKRAPAPPPALPQPPPRHCKRPPPPHLQPHLRQHPHLPPSLRPSL